MSDVSHVEMEWKAWSRRGWNDLFPLENLLSNGSKMDATLENPTV